MSVILVCGNRDWPGSLESIAAHLPAAGGGHSIVHGACSWRDRSGVQRSVDALADRAARERGIPVARCPVDHALDGPWPAAGPRRCARMLKEFRPDLGLAFGRIWRGGKLTGTGNMVSMMLNKGIQVTWIRRPWAAPVELSKLPDREVSQ